MLRPLCAGDFSPCHHRGSHGGAVGGLSTESWHLAGAYEEQVDMRGVTPNPSQAKRFQLRPKDSLGGHPANLKPHGSAFLGFVLGTSVPPTDDL